MPLRPGLPVARVAVTLLELAARTAWARGVPPHLGVVGAVGRGSVLLRLAAPVFARRAVLKAARALRAFQTASRQGSRNGRTVRTARRGLRPWLAPRARRAPRPARGS
jgi:hypothetical protein